MKWQSSSTLAKPEAWASVEKHWIFLRGPQNYTMLVVMALLCFSLHAEEPQEMTWRDAWRGLDEAVRLVEDEQYEEAGRLFNRLRQQAPEGEFKPDALRLLEATSFWKAGNPGETERALEGYEGLDDIGMSVQKRQLKGTVDLTQAENTFQQAQADPTKTEEAKERAQAAKEAFNSALHIDRKDDYSLTHLEKTLKLIEQIEELEQQQDQQQESEDQDKQESEQENQEENSEDQQDPQQDQQQQDQQNSEEEQENQQQQEPDAQDQKEQDQESKEQQDQEQSSDEDASSQEQPDPSEMSDSSDQPPEDYSEEQARQLLDTYDEQERRQRRQFLERRSRTIPVEKDW